jgi:hypothetical protein
MNYDTIADEPDTLRVDEARGQQVECKGFAVSNDRVSGVIASSTASAHIDLVTEDIDELALALVAPLRAEDHSHCSEIVSVAGRLLWLFLDASSNTDRS